jgi:hypothetical protein
MHWKLRSRRRSRDGRVRHSGSRRGGVRAAFRGPPRERVWRALSDPGELAGWLAPAEIDLRVGGSVVLKLEDGDERGREYERRAQQRREAELAKER